MDVLFQIWFIFVILIVISLLSAVGGEVWKSSQQRWYLDSSGGWLIAIG